MNGRKIGFWLTTLFVAVPGVMAAFAYMTGGMDEAMQHLGYPLYFATILGVWKILGAVALLSPNFAAWVPKVKDFAYAGWFFVFSGAIVSHLAVGDGAGGSMAPALMLVSLIASYNLRDAGFAPSAKQVPAAA